MGTNGRIPQNLAHGRLRKRVLAWNSVWYRFRSEHLIQLSQGYKQNQGIWGKKIDYSRCGASLDKNRETILKAAAKYARNSLDKSVEYYVAEVDSFYKQYPLCKGKDLTEMLTDISLVWLTLRNYQDVGEECSKNVAPAAAHGKPMNWRIEWCKFCQSSYIQASARRFRPADDILRIFGNMFN